MSAADTTLPPGTVLGGKYRLEKLLGQGGMGEVYRAENTLMGRTVAIKRLQDKHAHNADVVERFLREARAANLVRHPNVVDVLDVAIDDRGVPFIVQEFLEGEDLAARLGSAPNGLPWRASLELLRPAIEALAFAHGRGVIHRDLKPENLFLARTSSGVVPKVLDFGISKIVDNLESARITNTGVAMGTPAYMSPEQVQNAAKLDARADVWSLGVLLFETLTGQLPFPDKAIGSLFVAICTTDAPDVSTRGSNIPKALSLVVGRCLRRDLDARYPSAAELLRDLDNVLANRAPESTQKLAAVREDSARFPMAMTPSSVGDAARGREETLEQFATTLDGTPTPTPSNQPTPNPVLVGESHTRVPPRHVTLTPVVSETLSEYRKRRSRKLFGVGAVAALVVAGGVVALSMRGSPPASHQGTASPGLTGRSPNPTATTERANAQATPESTPARPATTEGATGAGTTTAGHTAPSAPTAPVAAPTPQTPNIGVAPTAATTPNVGIAPRSETAPRTGTARREGSATPRVGAAGTTPSGRNGQGQTAGEAPTRRPRAAEAAATEY